MSATVLWRVGAVPRRRYRPARPRARRGVFATLRTWRRRSRERAELAALDERMLRDIGITRIDAEFLSSKPFWKE
ncbi:MAG TPA: DUF1127 domain-containing protein [Stellaceae bacterium]